jgi:hypothetical protein
MVTLRPLYLKLHTWAKYKLAEQYHQPVPKKNSVALDQQSLGPGMAGLGRGGQH